MSLTKPPVTPVDDDEDLDTALEVARYTLAARRLDAVLRDRLTVAMLRDHYQRSQGVALEAVHHDGVDSYGHPVSHCLAKGCKP